MGKYTAIDDPSAYFQTATYTGTGSSLSITNDGNSNLKPDICWIKTRSSSTYNHVFTDSSRGSTKVLVTQGTNAEADVTNSITSYNTDGFTLGDWAHVNYSGVTYVGWQWKANAGTTSSNTDGSKTATVQANQDAGFSIVTYAGSGSASTVGHGLADTPDVIIFKNRSAANVWATYHQGLGNNYKLELNSANAQDSDGSFMNGTLPTSSVFTVGASVNTNGSGSNYVAYCFAEKQGYSKFGSYTGNGDATNGPFIYTGFSPAWVMIKNIETANRPWYMFDNQRRTFNPNGLFLRANTSDAEANDQAIDMLSNGFKIKPDALGSYGTSSINHSGQTMVYMAFAQHPFVTSTGIMGTAR